jgi:hypothetical protein
MIAHKSLQLAHVSPLRGGGKSEAERLWPLFMFFPLLSAYGPTLPTWALQRVVSYLRYTSLDANVVAEAALAEWVRGISPRASHRFRT